MYVFACVCLCVCVRGCKWMLVSKHSSLIPLNRISLILTHTFQVQGLIHGLFPPSKFQSRVEGLTYSWTNLKFIFLKPPAETPTIFWKHDLHVSEFHSMKLIFLHGNLRAPPAIPRFPKKQGLMAGGTNHLKVSCGGSGNRRFRPPFDVTKIPVGSPLLVWVVGGIWETPQ